MVHMPEVRHLVQQHAEHGPAVEELGGAVLLPEPQADGARVPHLLDDVSVSRPNFLPEKKWVADSYSRLLRLAVMLCKELAPHAESLSQRLADSLVQILEGPLNLVTILEVHLTLSRAHVGESEIRIRDGEVISRVRPRPWLLTLGPLSRFE